MTRRSGAGRLSVGWLLLSTLVICGQTPATRPASAPASAPAADAPSPMARGVRDPVFGAILGFVQQDLPGHLPADRISEAVDRSGRATKLPYRMIDRILREPSAGGNRGRVVSRFVDDIDLPVPYEILSYHPGSFRLSREMNFREIRLGDQEILHAVRNRKKTTSSTFRIQDVRIYILDDGLLEIDIDGWLDVLAGDNLDDTRMGGLIVFRRHGVLYGMGLGYTRKGDGRSGTISFEEDKVLYPNPPEFRSIARQMRRTLEHYAPGLRQRLSNW